MLTKSYSNNLKFEKSDDITIANVTKLLGGGNKSTLQVFVKGIGRYRTVKTENDLCTKEYFHVLLN
jgi:hypothetical protein